MHTPGPWVVEKGKPLMVVAEKGGMAVIVSDAGGAGSLTPADRANAKLIAMAPEMAEYLARMKCCYKAPEVANETCGHCIVCRAKAICS